MALSPLRKNRSKWNVPEGRYGISFDGQFCGGNKADVERRNLAETDINEIEINDMHYAAPAIE